MDITLTMWTVTVGDEDGQSLAVLAFGRDSARAAFDKQVAQLPAEATVQPSLPTGLTAAAGLDWVRMEPRPVQVSLPDLISAI
ncbi:hypothetical protein AB0E62_36990, partial [Streptomyces sp. NPDC038707]|uniref:hypothetical protein n=1 Tax=Streptomyces sp. NPDC038707 TaxID=3154329 RepID=UPI0033D2F0A1